MGCPDLERSSRPSVRLTMSLELSSNASCLDVPTAWQYGSLRFSYWDQHWKYHDQVVSCRAAAGSRGRYWKRAKDSSAASCAAFRNLTTYESLWTAKEIITSRSCISISRHRLSPRGSFRSGRKAANHEFYSHHLALHPRVSPLCAHPDLMGANTLMSRDRPQDAV